MNRAAKRPPLPPTPEPTPPVNYAAGPLYLTDSDPKRFEDYQRQLLAQLNPTDPVARLFAEQIILSAARLRAAALAEGQAEGIGDAHWCRYQGQAERQFRSAYAGFDGYREAHPEPEPEQPEPEETSGEIVAAYLGWKDRIALVRSVSTMWPVLLRHNLEVESVAAFLNTCTEEQILGSYPALSRADIAACRACDDAGLCGPYEDPELDGYPPGLPILDDLPEAFRHLPPMTPIDATPYRG